jgi:inorganic triphosphatase YgiF
VTATLEREVKLAASPAFRMPSLDELGDDVLTIPRDPERLQTVYFDTQDFRLARWGVSLRHREGRGGPRSCPPMTLEAIC